MDLEYFDVEGNAVFVTKLPFRINLDVPYEEKNLAKAAGARWDPDQKVWYGPTDANMLDLLEWIPGGYVFSRQFYIATSEQECWQCLKMTEVATIIVLSGFVTHLSYTGEYFGMGSPFHWPCFIRGIKAINKSAASQLHLIAPYFYLDHSKTADDEYFMNHCQHCASKQGEHFLYEEPEGAFLPVFRPSKISIRSIGGDLAANSWRSEIDPDIGRQIKWPVSENDS